MATTAADVEKLVDDMRAILAKERDEKDASRLAASYVRASQDVTRRLAVCGDHLRHGQPHQALFEADSNPPLLPIIVALLRVNPDAWRTFCAARGLPVPAPLDLKVYRTLNVLYGNMATTEHPLLADYLAGRLGDDRPTSVSVMRNVVRLRPDDEEAREDLAGLERDVLLREISDLEAMAPSAGAAEIVQRCQDIDAMELRADEDTVMETIGRRAGLLMGKIDFLRAAGKWQEVALLLPEIKKMESGQASLSDEAKAEIAKVQEWVDARRHDALQEADFHSRLTAMRTRIGSRNRPWFELKQQRSRRLTREIGEARAQWEDLKSFQRPIPVDLRDQYRDYTASLEAAVEERSHFGISIMVVVAIGLGMLAAVLVIMHFVHRDQERAEEIAADLNRLIANRNIKELNRVYYDDKKIKDKLASKHRALAEAMQKAEKTLKGEQVITAAFVKSFKDMDERSKKNFAKQSADRVRKQFDDLRAHLALLTIDQQASYPALLDEMQQKWEKSLIDMAANRNGSFLLQIIDAERLVDVASDLSKNPVTVRKNLAAAQNAVDALQKMTEVLAPELQIRDDSVVRLVFLQQKLASYQESLATHDESIEGLKAAKTLPAYVDELRKLHSSGLEKSPYMAASGQMLELDPNDDSVLGSIMILYKNPTWKITGATDTKRPFIPDTMLPEERDAIDAINKDPNLGHVTGYLLKGGSSDDSKARRIYVQGELELTSGPGWKKAKFFEPGKLTDTVTWQEKPYEVMPNGAIRFTSQGAQYIPAPVEKNKAQELLQTIGWNDLSSGGSYNAPLLGMLEKINQLPEESFAPMLRAYIFEQILGVMKWQPGAWGAAYAPLLAVHQNSLRDTGAEKLKSGDWWLPAKVKEQDKELLRYFAGVGEAAYLRQATILHAVVQQAKSAGLSYIGFCGIDTKPLLLPGEEKHPEMWGYAAKLNSPQILYRYSDSMQAHYQTGNPLPLTPLFTFKGDRAKIITDALAQSGVSPSDPLAGPLFSERPVAAQVVKAAAPAKPKPKKKRGG